MTGPCCRIARFGLLSVSLVWLFAFPATSQTSPPESTTDQSKSVANAARQAKPKVFTDDDMEVHKSPFL